VALVEVRNLTKIYTLGQSIFGGGAQGEVRAVDDVSFTIEAGETLGLVGESGSGKSTSALALLGLLAPEARIESGRALFKGQSLFDLPDAERRALRGNRMSIVFQAENPRLGNVIALKVLDPSLAGDDIFRTRFLEESRIAASMNHPNVIPIHDMGSSDGLLYIAMALVLSGEVLGKGLLFVSAVPN